MNLKKQLVELLEEKWNLTQETVKKENVDFTRFPKNPEKIVKPQVLVGNFVEPTSPLGGRVDNFLEVKALGTVSLLVKSVDQSDENKEVAEDNMDLMEEEVSRILAEETLPSSWDSAYVSEPKSLDPEGSPPLLQQVLTVFVYYIKTYGG